MGAGAVSQLTRIPHGLSRTGFVTALASEARTLRPIIRRRSAGAGDAAPLIAVAGVGPVAAAAAATALLRAGATSLVSWGYAGGLEPNLPAGTIVAPDRILNDDGGTLATDILWSEAFCASIAANCSVRRAMLLTSAFALTTVEQKAKHFAATGAAAVDMESAAIARVALEHRAPFLAVRVVLDAATDAAPRAILDAIGPTGEMRWARLCVQIARAPGDFKRLHELARSYRVARRMLTAAASAGRSCLCERTAAEVGA